MSPTKIVGRGVQIEEQLHFLEVKKHELSDFILRRVNLRQYGAKVETKLYIILV